MEKQILVPTFAKAKMKKKLNVSYLTIQRALMYRTNSELSEKIRQEAIRNFGGVESKN